MSKIEHIIEIFQLESAIAACPTPIRNKISRRRFGDTIPKLESMRNERTADNYSLKGFDKHNCIFVHIPKCAGVSVSNALFGDLAGGHLPLYLYLALYGSRRFDQMFKFTFVRNPWDRIASAYFFLKGGGMTKTDATWSRKWLSNCNSLNQFICEILPNESVQKMIHFCPQTAFLIDPRSNKIGVDFIGRYESIDKDFQYIASKLNINVNLTKLNKSSRPRYFRSEISLRAVEQIEMLYSQDISNFNYNFSPV